jgi:Holliday junction resolvase RusA-like endonuclease
MNFVEPVMSDICTFAIEGRCPTKGSTKSFVNPKTGKVVTMADSRTLKQWTMDARWQARAAKVPLIYKPHGVHLTVRVEFLRPKTAKQLAPTVRPDLDKLLRAVMDALTNVAYIDDSQVVSVATSKAYGPSERVIVSVGRAA